MASKPLYKITIDPEYSDGEELGIEQIAFTATPAIKVKGMAFSDDSAKKFVFTDDIKMRIVAPALIPMQIYRNDDMGEYYVEFTESEIDNIRTKFMSNLQNNGKFNLEHNVNEIAPAYILETWIVDEPLKDKAYTTFGIEVPKGTLMVMSQLTDKEYYTELVNNGQTGYSIEGFLGLSLSDLINKVNKQNKLKEMVLPNNTIFEVEGKKYIFTDNEVKEYFTDATTKEEVPAEKEVPAEDVPAAEETKMADTSTTDTQVTDAPATEEAKVDEVAILAIVQPKLDEIYKMIAELKNQLANDESDEAAEDESETTSPENVKMSVNEKFSILSKFIKE